MCLAVPAKIIEINGDMATIEVGGNTRQISIVLTPGVKLGDYVLLHAGFALEYIDPEEAKATLRLLEEFYGTVFE